MKYTLCSFILCISSIVILPAQIAEWQTIGLDSFPVHFLHEYQNELYAGAIMGGVFSSSDSTVTWDTVLTREEAKFPTAMAHNSNAVAIGTYHKGVYISRDSGASWTNVLKDFTGPLEVNDVLFQQDTLLISAMQGLFRLRPSEDTLRPINYPILSTITPYSYALYCQGDTIVVGIKEGVLVSSDSGVTWSEIAFMEGSHVTSLRTVGSKLLAGTSGKGIFEAYFTDLSSWTSSAEYVGGNANVLAFSIRGYNQDTLLKSTNMGAYFGTEMRDQGLGSDNQILDLCYHNGQLYAGTTSEGCMVWDTVTLSRSTSIPTIIDLNLSPNPTEDWIGINYFLEESQAIQLSIHRLDGQLIQRVINGSQLSQGRHQLNVDVSSLPPGVYYLSLSGQKTGDRQLTFIVQ